MLGFSLQKLLVLAAVVVAVWYGFKFLSRLEQQRKSEAQVAQREAARRAKQAASGSGGAEAAEEMVLCSACGAYVPQRGTRSCGRADCPYP